MVIELVKSDLDCHIVIVSSRDICSRTFPGFAGQSVGEPQQRLLVYWSQMAAKCRRISCVENERLVNALTGPGGP